VTVSRLLALQHSLVRDGNIVPMFSMLLSSLEREYSLPSPSLSYKSPVVTSSSSHHGTSSSNLLLTSIVGSNSNSATSSRGSTETVAKSSSSSSSIHNVSVRRISRNTYSNHWNVASIAGSNDATLATATCETNSDITSSSCDNTSTIIRPRCHPEDEEKEEMIVIEDDVRVLQRNLQPLKSCLKSKKKAIKKRTQPAQTDIAASGSSPLLSNDCRPQRSVRFPEQPNELASVIGTVTIYYEMSESEIQNSWYKVRDIEGFRSDGKLIANELRSKHVHQSFVKPIDTLYMNVQYIANTTHSEKSLYNLLTSLWSEDEDDDNESFHQSSPRRNTSQSYCNNNQWKYNGMDDDDDDDMLCRGSSGGGSSSIDFMDDNRIMNQNLANLYLEGFKTWSISPKVPTTFVVPTSASGNGNSRKTSSPRRGKKNNKAASGSSVSEPIVLCGRGLEHWTSKRHHTCRREIMSGSRRVVVEMSQKDRDTTNSPHSEESNETTSRLKGKGMDTLEATAKAIDNDILISKRYMEYTRASRILARIIGEADSYAAQKVRQEDEALRREHEQQLRIQQIQQQKKLQLQQQQQQHQTSHCTTRNGSILNDSASVSDNRGESRMHTSSNVWNHSFATI
jgi:hypothetical protein